MCYNVKLRDTKDIKHLSELACQQPFEVYVHSNDDALMVDARSLLGLFALAGKDCKLVVEDNVNPKMFAKFVQKCGLAA